MDVKGEGEHMSELYIIHFLLPRDVALVNRDDIRVPRREVMDIHVGDAELLLFSPTYSVVMLWVFCWRRRRRMCC